MHKMQRIYSIMGWLAVLYIALLFLYPLLQVILSSLSSSNGAFTTDYYERVLTGGMYLKVLGRTLVISVVSTLFALVIGYSLAYFLVNRPAKSQGIWMMIILSPMFMSLTVRLYGWMIILGNQGPIAAIYQSFAPEGSGMSLLFTKTAVVIGIVHYVVPFIVLNVYTSLKKLDPALLEASTMLGASGLRTFRKITLPVSMPGVYAGCAVAFALAANTFLVPIMLGGPQDTMLSNLAYNSVVSIGNLSLGSAISMVLLVIVLTVLAFVSMMERRGKYAS